MATYIGIGPERGNDIPADEALDYALQRCGISVMNQQAQDLQEFLEEFEGWFYSDAWYLEEDEDA